MLIFNYKLILIPYTLLWGMRLFAQPPTELDLNYYLIGSKNPAAIIRVNKVRKELIYRFSFDKHNKADTVLTDSILYNSYGKVLQSTEFIHLSRMKTVKTFYYDSLGRLQKIVEDHAFPKGYILTYVLLYDSSGREIVEGQYYGESENRRFAGSGRKVYDPAGKLIAIYRGKNFLETQFFYSDITGLLEKIVEYRRKNLKAVTYQYTYSINQHQRKIIEIGKGESHLYEEAFFDEQGRIERTISRQLAMVEENGYRWLIPDLYSTVLGTFSYNPDGTILEWTEYRGKRSEAVFHHYYETD